jgi:hypothetical protein
VKPPDVSGGRSAHAAEYDCRELGQIDGCQPIIGFFPDNIEWPSSGITRGEQCKACESAMVGCWTDEQHRHRFRNSKGEVPMVVDLKPVVGGPYLSRDETLSFRQKSKSPDNCPGFE